jgi:hypothetical protein
MGKPTPEYTIPYLLRYIVLMKAETARLIHYGLICILFFCLGFDVNYYIAYPHKILTDKVLCEIQ